MAWSGWREHDTRGVIIAGRTYDFGMFTVAEAVRLCGAINAIAERAGSPIVACPVNQDLSEDNTGDEDELMCSAFLGVLVAEGGTFEPLAVTREAMLGALEKVKAVAPEVWEEINAAYHEAGGNQPCEETLAVSLGCTGALPMAKLAFGVLGEKEDNLGGEFVRGQSPDQVPHTIGVHGQRLAGCSYDGSSAKPFDLGDDAHAARIKAIPNGGYYLMAQFD